MFDQSPFVYIVIAIVIRTVTQVLFKYMAISESGASYFALFSSPFFYCICILFAALTWTWQRALSYYPLSFVYPFTSIVFVTLLLSGSLFFHEHISMQNVLGSVVIIIGVVVISQEKVLNRS